MIGGVSSTRRKAQAKKQREKNRRQRKRGSISVPNLSSSEPPCQTVSYFRSSSGESIDAASSPASMPNLPRAASTSWSEDESEVSFHTAAVVQTDPTSKGQDSSNPRITTVKCTPYISSPNPSSRETSFRDDSVGTQIIDDTPKNKLLKRYNKIAPYIADARNTAGNIVNDERVQMIIIALISINGIMMGIATFDFVAEDPEVDDAFEKVDFAFLIIFTVELGLQFIYRSWRLFTDGWLLFDFVIIFMSWAFSGVQIIRAFRIFRALRLVTRIEVMKNLVSALFSVIPKMFAIGLLLALVFYIFAVMYTSLFKTMYDDGLLEYDYFGTIWASLFTCFQFMTLDDWNPIAREVMAEKQWAWFPFIAFIIVSGFIIVNLIIAVICDAVSALQDIDKEGLTGGYAIGEASSQGGPATDNDERRVTFENFSNDRNNPVVSNGTRQNEGRGSPPADRRLSLQRSGSASSINSKNLRMSLTKDKKDSDRILREVVHSERLVIAQKVDILENQIEELTRLQKEGTRVIEQLMKHIQDSRKQSTTEAKQKMMMTIYFAKCNRIEVTHSMPFLVLMVMMSL